MKYLLTAVFGTLFLFSGLLNAQPFFATGMIAGSESAVNSGSGSLGASIGPGQYVTGGIAGAGAGSTAFSGASLGGGSLTFFNGGASGTLSGSAVGGASSGQAGAGSGAAATGSASHQALGGLLFVVP